MFQLVDKAASKVPVQFEYLIDSTIINVIKQTDTPVAS